MSQEELIRFIQNEIQKKYGQEILYAKDCQHLSKLIYQVTNRQISVTTLKRFFGIVKSPFQPSKYTLDTLAKYLNHDNWHNFLNDFENSPFFGNTAEPWTELRNRVSIITENSFQSLTAKIGGELSDFPHRSFASEKFEAFMNSSKVASAFIAPEGYGKSTLIAQLVDDYFTGEEPIYPKDIVCLVDGSILVDLLNENTKIFKLQNLLDFDVKRSFSLFFRENPAAVKGRFVLIIDGLYGIYYQAGKIHKVVENLMDVIVSYKDISWFKLLVVTRPDNWRLFSNIIDKHPELASYWFDVSFEPKDADNINIPLLSNSEIKVYLEKKHSRVSFENLLFHYPDIKSVLKNPYLLQLFVLSQTPENIYSEIDLLTEFVRKKVFSGAYLTEKSQIIDAFLDAINQVKSAVAINKEDLSLISGQSEAYQELVSDNILYEYPVTGSYFSVTTFVNLSHNILSDFLLANKWLKENSFNLDLLKRVYEFYKDNAKLQTNILKHLIKYAFKEKKVELLKDVYTIFEKEIEDKGTECIRQMNADLINIVGVGLRNNKDLRDVLVPHYAKSRLGQLLYFESFFDLDSLVLYSGDNIDYYLAQKQTLEAKIGGYFLKFMQYFLAGDRDRSKHYYKAMAGLDLGGELCPTDVAYYCANQIIYQSVFASELDKDLLDKMYLWSDYFFETGKQAKTDIPVFEDTVLFALNYGQNFAEIIQLMEHIIKKYQLDVKSLAWQNQLAFLIYARALLNTGKTEDAHNIYTQIDLKSIPENLKNYIKLRYHLIQLEFLIFDGKKKKAKRLIANMKDVSKMIRYKYFYDECVRLEKSIPK